MRRLPEPTRVLLGQLRGVARLLDRVTARLHPPHDAADVARRSAQTVWAAIDRLEDLAGLVEELAPADDVRCEGCGVDLPTNIYLAQDDVPLCRACFYTVPNGAEVHP